MESDKMFFENLSCLIHVIQKNDTLYSISRQYNVSLSLILRLNPYAEVYNLQIGDEICIPMVQAVRDIEFVTYMVREGDTLESILENFGINLQDLLNYNRMIGNNPQTGDMLQIPVYQ